MRKLLLFILLILFQFGLSQTTIKVLDGYSNDNPLEGVVVVTDKNKELGKTNSDGIFVVAAQYKQVTLFFDGYESQKLYLYGKPITVVLEPIKVDLSESNLMSTDSEARKIIKKSIQEQKKNNIRNLKSYEYKSYAKFLVTASTDSMPYILFPKNHRDSSYNDVRKLLDESHLMLGERAMDHKYSAQYGEKNIVRASKISGTQLPMYEFVAMQPISSNFDEEKIKLFFKEFINPLSQSGLKEYRYRIAPEETIEGRPMWVIAFHPNKKSINKHQIKGSIWIDKETKALAKFYGENLSETHVVELEMDWTHFNNYWFPSQQRFRMDGGIISYPSVKDSVLPNGMVKLDTIKKREKVWLHLTNSYKDLISPQDFTAKEFKGYANEIDLVAMDQSDLTLINYRDAPLTRMEENTYIKIDSIGQKYKMDRNLKILRAISSGGKYSIGKYDLDLTSLFNYNDYEGVRLGLGGSTNYHFNPNFSLNGYAAYGFKDKKVKFGGGIDWFVNKPYSGKFFASYAQDVAASGRNSFELQNNYINFLRDNMTNIYNRDFYSYRRVKLGYQQDFWQNFTFSLSGIYNEKTAEFDYQYQDNRPDEKFLSFDTELALRWAPKDQYVRTPYGKVTINSGMPIFYLTLAKAWNVFNADYTPTKLNFTYLDRYRTLFGQTDFQLNSGVVFGDTPLFNLYEGMGNAKGGDKVFKHFGIAGMNNFETMRPGEFYSDKYLMFNISHKFMGFRFFKKEIFPEFIYRGLIGDMKNPQDHFNIDFKTPKNYYQEAGIEFNQLLGFFGLGAYYRLGDYAFDTFDENFYLKLTLKMTFF